VPCRPAHAGPRVLERLELQLVERETYALTIGQKALPVDGYEVRHGTTLPHVAVEPEPTVHGVDHPLAAFLELSVGWPLGVGHGGSVGKWPKH
jgi:hypothetical protein